MYFLLPTRTNLHTGTIKQDQENKTSWVHKPNLEDRKMFKDDQKTKIQKT